jgi:LuxR family quorum-sensing system transcriptional regulator CciR
MAFELASAIPAMLPSLDLALERSTLTDRECECLLWVARGKTSWEAGVILGIAERTVKKHVIEAMAKLDATSRAHAVAKAMVSGAIRP